MGFFDDDSLGDLFDFDGDGKTSVEEEFMAYMMFEEDMKKEEKRKYDWADEQDDDLCGELPYEPRYVSTLSALPSNTPKDPGPDTTKTDQSQPCAAPLSMEEYRAVRKDALENCIAWTLGGLFICLVLVGVVWAAFKVYDPKKSSSAIMITLLIGLGIWIFLKIASFIGKTVHAHAVRYRQADAQFQKTLSEAERKKSSKRKKVILYSALGLLAAGLIALFIVNGIQDEKIREVYQLAEDQITEQHFEEAQQLLTRIEEEDYRDTAALIKLCKAHVYYSEDNLTSAYDTIKDVRFSFQSETQVAAIEGFRRSLKEEYDAYRREMSERAQEAYEHEQSLPFPSVGQHVSKSQLDEMRWNGADSSSFIIPTTKYICTVYGKKFRLWISESNKILRVEEITSGTASGTDSGRGSAQTDDGPSVDEYADAEEFYEWNKDDFYDYEDAEDYYYDHGGD